MVDITVRGAGIFGLSIAWVCAKRGARVCVVDPYGPGAGSSGGVVGALAPHVPENWNTKKAFQLESLLMAEGFWRDVGTAGGRSAGYARSGRIQPVADEAALGLARQRSQTAQDLWNGAATWQVEKRPDTAWMPHSPSGWIIRDTLSALLHPRQAVEALCAALAAHSVEITDHAPDRGKVLWATGYQGLLDLNGTHSRMVGTGVKGQAAVFGFDAAQSPQLFVDGLHIIPHRDGTVAIGSTSERDFEHPDTTDDQLDHLIGKARIALPILNDAPVIARWAGVRPRARTRAPMLGPWPGRPDLFIANGGFKIGFGMAPKIAHVMADLMLDERDTIPQGFEVAASF